MSGSTVAGHRCVLLLGVLAAALGWFLAIAATAVAISAPIHIHGTGGEGVFIRPTPDTSRPAVGWMPEGASPDFHCFVWGQNINGVPIWFNVTYNGVTGYYASYFDDSSYHSNEELTAKYGVPLCGSAPPPSSPPPPMSESPSSAPVSPPAPAAVYFSPFDSGKYEVGDGRTVQLYVSNWQSGCESSHPQPRRPYEVAKRAVGEHPIVTLAGWSKGRQGVISFLANASSSELKQVGYVLLIDPGSYGEMNCDRERHAGDVFANWLRVNPNAHLVIVSGSQVTQLEGSKGIQESYFNSIRRYGSALNPRVLTCNYSIGHTDAFLASKYWIQHQIGSTRSACPWLSLRGNTIKPTAGWHPINN